MEAFRAAGERVRPLLFGVAGACLALALAGRVSVDIGPFDTTASVRPGLSGQTTVRLSPLGSLQLDTHDAPIDLELRVEELRLDEAKRIADDPGVLESLEGEIAADARRALLLLTLKCLAVAAAGGGAGALAARVRVRSAAIGAAAGTVLVAGVGAAAAATFDDGAIAEPRYSGLLTIAPTAVGDLETVVGRFGQYRAQLTELVGNVVTLYQAAQGLPTFEAGDETIRVLHVSDIHLNPQAFDLIDLLADQFDVDAVLDTGDLTDWGTEPEGGLTDRIRKLDVPYVWVRGNHDSDATQASVAAQPNAVVLDGGSADVAGLRIWGIADERYTPNKDQPTGKNVERDQAARFAPTLARMLRQDEPATVDVVMVHDARMAADIGDDVRLILAGHTHQPRTASIGAARLLVEGSTGGAGLRGLRDEEPEPLTCTILYFDPDTRGLVAYDRIVVRGLGESGARIERHVIDPPDGAGRD
ncbi:MAG TPA: metallophosphoesterase [Acidimicrobiales bacterium]